MSDVLKEGLEVVSAPGWQEERAADVQDVEAREYDGHRQQQPVLGDQVQDQEHGDDGGRGHIVAARVLRAVPFSLNTSACALRI